MIMSIDQAIKLFINILIINAFQFNMVKVNLRFTSSS